MSYDIIDAKIHFNFLILKIINNEYIVLLMRNAQ